MKRILKGFTIVELLIVIIIIGILASVAIPIYTNIVEKEKGEACINNMRAVLGAWYIYDLRHLLPFITARVSTPLTLQQINTGLNIQIDERNFGSAAASVPGFLLERVTPTQYQITAFRLGTGQTIICDYYPDAITIPEGTFHYRWSGTWVDRYGIPSPPNE